jgi:hypothetical protein
MEDIKTCPVCYSEEHLKHLNCSHLLCCNCYKLLPSKICPICRIPINQEIFRYKPPLHKPNLKFHKFKEKLELFFKRRNFLAGCGFSKKYRKYLFYMVHYGNVYYFKGTYYPVNVNDGVNDGYFQISDDLIQLTEFYKYLLTSEKYLLPDLVRKKLIENVEETFQYF